MNAKAGARSGAEVGTWRVAPGIDRMLLTAGIGSVVVYGLGDLVSGLLYDGYSFIDHVISELSAFGSPVRPLMVTVMVIHAVLVAAFGVGIWRTATSRSLRWAGLTLLPVGLVGIPNHTVFAMSSRGMEGGFNDTMHMILSNVFGLLVTVAIVLAAVAIRGWFRWYSLTTVALLAGFAAAAWSAIQGIDQNLTPWAGGFERINAYAYFAWLVVLAVVLLRRPRVDAEEGASQPTVRESVMASG